MTKDTQRIETETGIAYNTNEQFSDVEDVLHRKELKANDRKIKALSYVLLYQLSLHKFESTQQDNIDTTVAVFSSF